MKKNKLIGTIIFGLIVLLPILGLSLNSVIAFNNAQLPCTCHDPSSNVSLTVINQTLLSVNTSQDFTISFYASTTQAGGSPLTIRFYFNPDKPLTTTPEMVLSDTGIQDGDGNDPDGSTNDNIGDSGNPATVVITNVPSDNAVFELTIIAADGGPKVKAEVKLTIQVGEGGEGPETPLEWFLRTQPIIITIICVVFVIGIAASIIVKKFSPKKSES